MAIEQCNTFHKIIHHLMNGIPKVFDLFCYG